MRNGLKMAARVALLSALAGCGGSKAARGNAVTATAGAPEWVNRGSHVENGSIYGVGATEGIRNTELARSTAANRGRAEVSKILEVYSASLMKDYQASTTAGDMKASSEEQHVESAIKTFSANLMNGSEVKEYWLDPGTNTQYALIELNLERSREVAVARAKMGPGLSGWVQQNQGKVLADLEHAGGGGDASPASGTGGSSGAAPGGGRAPDAAADNGPPARVGGAPPGWTSGACDRDRYLCGVGSGGEQAAADIAARAELGRIFQSNIRSVAQSFEGATRQISGKTGETWSETQNVSQYSMVSSDKNVSMSQVLERWDDGKGRVWSLAVIDRAQASAALRDQIQSKDGVVNAKVQAARGTSDKIDRLQALKGAAAALAEREALNADLRVIQRSGQGVPAPHDISEIVGMLDSAVAALSIGIGLAGQGADKVQGCLEEQLTAKGYRVQAQASEQGQPSVAGNYDVILEGTLTNEQRPPVDGIQVVRTTLTLRLIKGATRQVLETFSKDAKASKNSVAAAVSASAVKVCVDQVPTIVSSIDRYFAH